MVDAPVQSLATAVRQGGCACGRVRYLLRGEPLQVGLCHCTDCRKTSGSMFSTFGAWPESAFNFQGDVGNWQGREFCPACGSQVFSRQPERKEVEIRLGSLDDAPTLLAPGHELWIRRREPWLTPVAGAAPHAEDAPRHRAARKTCS
jgi:hypothetical protein